MIVYAMLSAPQRSTIDIVCAVQDENLYVRVHDKRPPSKEEDLKTESNINLNVSTEFAKLLEGEFSVYTDNRCTIQRAKIPGVEGAGPSQGNEW